MKKIVVAMDSMKGCLDSYEASEYAADGAYEMWPDAEIIHRQVSDGGEGMVYMMVMRFKEEDLISKMVSGPLGEKVNPIWVVLKEEGCLCAYMDFSSAAGLTLIDEDKRNPLRTSSYGVGEMINDALKAGIENVRLGLGGSATVDAGLGALQAMGLRLLDAEGNEFPSPITGGMLSDVADMEFPTDFKEKISRLKLMLLCDVEAPFTGENGAARVFGPQKGADSDEVEILEKGMENVRQLILGKTGIDLNSRPGSGAAGGAAGGLMALAGGEIRKGASTLLDLSGFEKDIEGADLIITGEGSSDRQTLMGKIPYEILQRGKKRNIPVWLVAGRIKDREALLEAGFERILCIKSPDIVWRSDTVGLDPMDPEVARRRLEAFI